MWLRPVLYKRSIVSSEQPSVLTEREAEAEAERFVKYRINCFIYYDDITLNGSFA
jgi:hypothetical protein